MLFNSYEFIIFLIIVFVLYWFLFNKNLNKQNILILISSYLFYGWWDWRFLALIMVSSLIDYTIGLKIHNEKNNRIAKNFLLTSLILNLGLLFVFKYFNFFSDSLFFALNSIGYELNNLTLKLILPVGISFYTFQSISYTIDIYRKKLSPTKDIFAFFAYVSFFPQLVAGPIERASNLLPQFTKKRRFKYQTAVDGLRQILWGMFKKVVIADNCAIIVDQIFESYYDQSGLVLILGAFYFSLQIYGDFSGYSDIAIGTAKLFGFQLMTNFKTPYFSRDIAEFWRRWHISLSTWFRDYLYIPLGGSRVSSEKTIRNIFIIFIVSGFWHGANWTFIFWGLLHAIYFIPLYLIKKNRDNLDVVANGRLYPKSNELIQIFITFSLVCFSWIFFRSSTIFDAFSYINMIFENSFLPQNFIYFKIELIFLIIIFIIAEWVLFRYDDYLLRFRNFHPIKRRLCYLVVFFLMYIFMVDQSNSFIYFQF